GVCSRAREKLGGWKLQGKKGACTGRGGLFIGGVGESPRLWPPRLAKWAQRFKEMTQKRRGRREIRACQATNCTEWSYDLPADDAGAWWTPHRVPMHPCR